MEINLSEEMIRKVTEMSFARIFGDRFHDETQSEPEKVISKKETTTTTKKKTAQKPTSKPMDAEYEPVKTWYDAKTVNIVKWVMVFMGLEYLFFYWQQTGQMQSTAAMPSMIVCALLAGVSVGKNWKWRN